jgi:hypothetical protein
MYAGAAMVPRRIVGYVDIKSHRRSPLQSKKVNEPMATASDIRPSHADLDALLASTSLTVEARRAVIDALGSAALLWGGKPPLAAVATDPKGRLSIGDVDALWRSLTT